MKYAYILLSLIFSSCEQENKFTQIVPRNISDDFSKIEELSNELLYDSIEIINPQSIMVKDSMFFVLDLAKENKIYCYNLLNQEVITSFLSKGRAANEMMSTTDINLRGKDSIQVSSGFEHKKILIYSFDDIIGKRENNPKLVNINNDSIFLSNVIFYMGDNEIFGAGHTDKIGNRFIKYNVGSNSVENFEKYEDRYFENENLSSEEKKKAYSIGSYAINPSNGKVAISYMFLAALDIVDIRKGEIVKSIYYDRPKIEVKIVADKYKITGFAPEKKRGFSSITAGNSYIYGICSGKLNGELENGFSDKIYVYDWKLNPIKCLTTDKKLRCIYVTPDDTYIYVVFLNEGKYKLARYEL